MDRGVSRQIRVSRHRAGLEPGVGELGGANLGRVAGPRGGQGPRGLLSPTCLGGPLGGNRTVLLERHNPGCCAQGPLAVSVFTLTLALSLKALT